MGDISFGATTGMLKNAMDGASEAHAAIANNIANVNTLNFRRMDVTFKEALARTETAAPGADPTQLSIVTTTDRHIAPDAPAPVEPFAVTRTLDESQQMRVDGSNVDVDQEMAQLSQNSAYGQTMAQLLQVQFTRLREVISEQVV